MQLKKHELNREHEYTRTQTCEVQKQLTDGGCVTVTILSAE